jgi:hypothetical protein
MSGAYTALGALVIAGGSSILSSALSKPRKPGPPPVMPDLTTQTQLQTLQESKDAALRYGRAATILTNPGGAGGASGSDKLGP